MRIAGAFVVLLAGAIFCFPGSATGEGGGRVKVDEADIYWGDPSDFARPAVVNVDAVYARIPEYREIVDRDMDERNPKYLFLLRAASDRFRTAIRRTAKRRKFDLIGGLGSIRIQGKTVPDATAEVIRNLPH